MNFEISRDILIKAKKIGLRNGKWFRLHPVERLLINLAIKTLTRIKSQTLKNIILRILKKISQNLVLKFKIFQIGLEIVRKRINQALKFGNKKAKDWIKDTNYIMYLGYSQINTLAIYRL